MSNDYRVLVVGAGLACARLVQALRTTATTDMAISVVGDERYLPYDRPPLSKDVLTTATPPHGSFLLPEEEADSVHWALGSAAHHLDVATKRVKLRNGAEHCYDVLVVATGCRARPLPGAPEVPTLRTLDDARRLRTALNRRPGRLVLVGAGFVGSEIAAAAVGLGWEVVVIDTAAVPLAPAVGTHVALWLWEQHRVRGVATQFEARVTTVQETGGGYRVNLDNGTEVSADLVLAGLGALPNTDWLSDTSLDTSDGVRTDETMRAVTTEGTPLDGVFAMGDVARAPSPTSGLASRTEHWSMATTHARIVASAISDETRNGSRATPPVFWTDLYQHRVQVAGEPAAGEPQQPVPGGNGFAVDFHGREGRTGSVAVNWPAHLGAVHRELSGRTAARNERTVSHARSHPSA